MFLLHKNFWPGGNYHPPGPPDPEEDRRRCGSRIVAGLLCFLQEKRMSPELAQWIPPAVIVGVMLYLHRMTRQDMKQMESRLSGRIDGVESKIENLRDRMDSQNGDLRDRMGRIEGTLDVLREFLVGVGRGTAA